MFLEELVGELLKDSPVAVMARGLFEFALRDDDIDAVFEKHSERQYHRELLFSQVVDLMGLVVCKTCPSLSAAIRKRQGQLPVTRKAIYSKINGVEPEVCQALVRDVSSRIRGLLAEVGSLPESVVPGRRLLVLDGNHLAATDHRIRPLRATRDAALPGKSLVVFDPQVGLVCHAVCSEDGHAQERRLTPDWLDLVQAREVWVADRNFCTDKALRGVIAKGADFVIRQHGQMSVVAIGERRECGRTDGGTVHEQDVVLGAAGDNPQTLRRITVTLDHPTRHQEKEIHILTSLPREEVDGLRVSAIYRGRWEIEAVFGELKAALKCEVRALGHPKAALFAFCTALLAYDVISAVKHVIRAAHGPKTPELSGYYLADEVSGMGRAMRLRALAPYWAELGRLGVAEMAAWLLRAARGVNIDRFTKAKRSPKKPPPAKTGGGNGAHVSTYKLLQEAATVCVT